MKLTSFPPMEITWKIHCFHLVVSYHGKDIISTNRNNKANFKLHFKQVMETVWFPCGHHLVSMWTPLGLHVDIMVSMWFPCGHHVVSMWTQHGYNVDTMWFPGGYHVVSMWTPHGFHVSMWSPSFPASTDEI